MTKEGKQFKPMLAASVTNKEELVFPLYASPKLDGVRALVINGVVMSRSLKPIPNEHVQKKFGKAKFNDLDGELIVGDPTAQDVYRKTTSAVMSHKGEPDVEFFIFDDFTEKGEAFEDRLSSVKWRGTELADENVTVVGHTLLKNLEALNALEEKYLARGFEGVMLRKPSGPYKSGRSTLKESWLVKVKQFEDSEATIIGFIELMQNTNEATTNELGATSRSHKKAGMVGKGCLGALTVKDLVTGVVFEIGSGFDQATREHIWANRKSLKGKLVKYKYFAGGVKDKPRFPVFIGFRDASDL